MMTNKTPYRFYLRSRTFAFDGHLPGGAWPCFISKVIVSWKFRSKGNSSSSTISESQDGLHRCSSRRFSRETQQTIRGPSFSELRNRWVGVKACKTWNKNVRIHMNSHHRRRYESSINWDADYSQLHGNPTVAENDNEVIKRKSGGHE